MMHNIDQAGDRSDPIPLVNRDDTAAHSGDVVAENVAALKALFPSIVTDGRVDLDVLRQLLGDEVDDGEERYGLNWKGKKRARAFALTPSLGTLRPAKEDSVDWGTTKNIVIEGDNLEVLKLLRKSYAGRVKLIYIDPPYNTGNDFVYPDDYRDSIGNYERLTGQRSAEGVQMTSNKEASGRFHTDWLNMMYPRLMLAKELLSSDGAIFVSCDETEQANLRAAMSAVFGETNFIADMVWAAGRKNDSRLISVSHEYIVCYAQNAETLRAKGIEWRQRKKGLEAIYKKADQLRNEFGNDFVSATKALKAWYKGLPDGDPSKAHSHYSVIDQRGVYFPDNISWPGGGGPKYEVLHPVTGKAVAVPSRGWMTSDPAKMQAWIDDHRVHFGPDETYVPCIKSYLKDRELQTPYSVFYQDGRSATKRLRDLMGADVFDFPKDEGVLQEIVEMASGEDDLILDFFAGSGTTAHAVMAQNAVDGAARRYILVQLPEPLDPSNSKQKIPSAYCDEIGRKRTISELTKERLRRAGAKVRNEHSGTTIDTGFRVYTLASSNLKPWQPDPENLEASLLDAVDNVLPGRTEDDLLVELLLKTGIDLTLPSETRTIAGKTVNALGGGVLMVCLGDIAEGEAEELGKGICNWRDELDPPRATTFYFKDSGFATAASKANLAAIIRQRLGKAGVEKLGSI